VERRAEARFEVDRQVQVTSLEHPADSWTATVRNLSGRGMRLIVPQAIDPGSPIRVDADNIMFLGEVCYCHAEGSGYAIGLMVEHVLTGLDELERLNRGLFGEPEQDSARSHPKLADRQGTHPADQRSGQDQQQPEKEHNANQVGSRSAP